MVFAYHGYPALIHRLTYKRANHDNFHVHGFMEEGTTTTPFDMVVRNKLDRFHLMDSVLDVVPRPDAVYLRQKLRDWLVDHEHYIRERGTDLPMVRDWVWSGSA